MLVDSESHGLSSLSWSPRVWGNIWGEAWSVVFLEQPVAVGCWLLLCDLSLVSLHCLSGKLPGTGEIFFPSILVPLGAWCNREHLNYCFPKSVKMRFLIALSASFDIFLLFDYLLLLLLLLLLLIFKAIYCLYINLWVYFLCLEGYSWFSPLQQVQACQ